MSPLILTKETGFNQTHQFYLTNSQSFATISVLGAWCESAAALFATADLSLLRACAASSAMVGKGFLLETLDHKMSGFVQVVDDCTFMVGD